MAAHPSTDPVAPAEFAHRAIADSRVVGLLRVRGRRMVWANAAFAEMFGYPLAELAGQDTAMLFVDAAAREAVRVRSGTATAAGEVFRDEIEFVRGDGTSGRYQVSWAELGPGSDEHVGAFVDVTPRARALEAVVHSESRLRAIFEAMSEGLIVHSPDGRIIEANAGAERILGRTREQLGARTSADPAWRTIREDGSPFLDADHPAMVTLRTGLPLRGQIMGIERDRAGVRWIRINTQPIYEGEPAQLVAAVATFTDVTDERSTAAALRRARDELQSTLQWLRTITDRVPMSIALYDTEDRIVFANAEYARIGRPGLTAEGSRAIDFLRPELYALTVGMRRRALAGERLRLPLPVVVGGETRQREVTYTPYHDIEGRTVGVLVLGYDITELETSRARLREIAERLSTVREVERREIAMTLHERAAQDLYAARLAIERLRSSARDVDTEAALGDIHGIIEQAVREIGALTNDLYPTALQHLALPDVLAQHAAKFEQRSGVGVTFEAAEPFPVLHPDVRLLLFRAAQEALTNVWRHARAGHVHMTLTADDAIRLTVEDDGIGLTPGSDMKAGSLGVLGMRERFGALGGGFSLGPSPHGGARLAAWLPARAG